PCPSRLPDDCEVAPPVVFARSFDSSLEVGFLSGGDAIRVFRLARTDLLRSHGARLRRALPDFDHTRCDLSWNETGFGFLGSEIWKAERHYEIVDFNQCVQA